jgi:hypothetical protein
VTYSFNGAIVQGYEQRQLAGSNDHMGDRPHKPISVSMLKLLGRKICAFRLTTMIKINRGILLAISLIPGVLGLQPGTQNAGSAVENKGWEFQVGSNHQWGDFTLRTNLNYSINNNEVIDMAGRGAIITGNDIDPRFIIDKGYPMNCLLGV